MEVALEARTRPPAYLSPQFERNRLGRQSGAQGDQEVTYEPSRRLNNKMVEAGKQQKGRLFKVAASLP
jgi:hypothetical protein